MRRAILYYCAIQLALLAALTPTSQGQTEKPKSGLQQSGDRFGSFVLPDADLSAESPLTVSAQFTPADGKTPAKLWVTAKLATGWHTYSLTQPPGGPTRTTIVVKPSGEFTVGEFTPTVAPIAHPSLEFSNTIVEEHSGELSWWAPLKLSPGVNRDQLEISGHLFAQLCKTSCLQAEEYHFVAKLAASAPKSGKESFETAGGTLTGVLEPSQVAPGGKAELKLTFMPTDGWHVNAQGQRDPLGTAKELVIALSQIEGLTFSQPMASVPPTKREGSLGVHKEPVTWTLDVGVSSGMPKNSYPIGGILGFQACVGDKCDMPRAARFAVTIEVGSDGGQDVAPVTFNDAEYAEAVKLDEYHRAANMPLPLVILLSLVGGAILNLMPCVLPVLGLKILSFVEQAGQHRRQILALNLWYSAGLIMVFLVLASLAVFLNLGWGQQFSSTAFNVVMSAVVFVMALSFLGVWEIPIPGFVGSGKSTQLAAREGASGAFAKGVLTTVLATPCSGPFLGSVFGFTLRQPPAITYLIFTCIGLGMASPYLLIGAFPRLVRFLPKPGAWMDTFKQLMGFALLGTVVYMFTFLNRDYLVPTFALLVGLWLGCWWIGRTPLVADFRQKVRSWSIGMGAATAIGAFAFTMLTPQVSLIPWQPFSKQTLADLTKDGKTVFIDFTADWCPTCKTNMKFAINTTDVRDAVEANQVVPLLADWTSGSAEVKSMLASLNSKSIPVLAIFPASRPDQPIILRDVITKQQVLDAIKEAGPSVGGTLPVRSAERVEGAE